MSVNEEEASNGGDTEALVPDQAAAGGDSNSRGDSGGGKKQKNQKKKFDISLPAQHLVSADSNLFQAGCNLISLSLSLSIPHPLLQIVSW